MPPAAPLRSDITLRLTWPGESDNDWIVVYRGEDIGRIYYAVQVPQGCPPWFWYCNAAHPQVRGTAMTLESAKDKWLEALAAALKKVSE